MKNSPANKALTNMYAADPDGYGSDDPKEHAALQRLHDKVWHCDTCGDELMHDENGRLAHHDGRYSYGTVPAHQDDWDHDPVHSSARTPKEAAKPVPTEMLDDTGVMKPFAQVAEEGHARRQDLYEKAKQNLGKA